MDPLAAYVTEAGYRDRLLDTRQLARILGGSDQRRYGLVNRALKSGALLRLKRGLYALSEHHRTKPLHPFRIAQALAPGSYVSFETALAHHGWIPEAVYATASIVPGRKSHEVTHPYFERFTFHPLAINRPAFLELVYRHDFDGQAAFVATPARALLDLVCFRKIEWRGLDWIEDGLRIDPAHILTIRKKDYATLKSVYKYKAVIKFLHELEKAAAEKRADVRTGEKS